MMKYALVTGSTRGIGAAIADKLRENDFCVFRNSRGESNDPQTIQADLSTIDGVNKLADAVLTQVAMLDCVVLNAGATCRKSLKEIGHTDWQTVIDTNVTMPFFLVQRLFDRISDGGSLLFVSSATSIKPHATSVPYGVTKAAVNMLAQSLVKEFAPRGIRVNVICPGFIGTDWQKEKPDWLREKIESKIALKRFGTPNEVADACLLLINNSYLNGAIVQVDGGYDFE